ncbi:MAG: tetratricopeptide repeat protein [Bdellovibrionales bacterium]|nr:tetratricopeptide repeat protein [Bdellovibrionales bacterium]
MIVGFSLLVGCTSSGSKDANDEIYENPVPVKHQQAFERGMAHLERNEFRLALKEFDAALQDNASSEFYLVTLFNKGAALEGLERCSEATNVYRQSLRLASKRFPRIEAHSLFRLAYTYECMGDVPKQIASLRDALRRKKFLYREISEAELPARLASAYARTGDLKSAEKYFEMAQKGLVQVHSDEGDPSRKKELLARTLYFMGRMQPKAEKVSELSEAYIGSLKYLQGYLLKSSEMDSKDWSLRAADNLVGAYEVIWQALERPPQIKQDQGDQALTQKATQEWKLKLAQGAIANIQSLRAMRFPDPKEPLVVQQIFREMETQERKLTAYLADLAVTTDLTPDAKKREGLKREGRVVSPNTSLESKAAPKAQKPKGSNP